MSWSASNQYEFAKTWDAKHKTAMASSCDASSAEMENGKKILNGRLSFQEKAERLSREMNRANRLVGTLQTSLHGSVDPLERERLTKEIEALDKKIKELNDKLAKL